MRSILGYLKSYLYKNAIPIGCLLFGLCITVVLYVLSAENEKEKGRTEFLRHSEEFRTALSNRIQSYIDTLPGLKALSSLERRASDARVKRFVSAISLQERFPSIAFIFVADHIHLEERDAYISQVRNDRSLKSDGRPTFDIIPSGERPTYLVIRHVSPESLPTVGYDLYDPSKSYKEEIDEAINNGTSTATKPIVLARDRNSPRVLDNTSIVIREPVYVDDVIPKTREERQKKLQGIVGIAFQTKELVNSVLTKEGSDHLYLRVRDLLVSENEVAIFDNGFPGPVEENKYKNDDVERSIISVANRQWEIVAMNRTLSASYWYQPIPLLVLICGLSVSLLFALILRMLVNRTHVAELAVEDALSKVRRERRALEEAQSIATIGSWEWDIKNKKLYCSAEMVRIYGISADEFIKNPRHFFKRIPFEERKLLRQKVWSVVSEKKTIKYEHHFAHSNQARLILQINSELQYDSEEQLRAIVGTVQDVTERRKNEREIKRLAFADPLTNLVNRRLLIERVSSALLEAEKNSQIGALIFLDLDNFKTVNDAKGHATGDALLVLVAQRLKLYISDGDTAARLGGDEFVLLIKNLASTLEDAMYVAIQITECVRISLSQPYQISDVEYQSSASMGITLFPQGGRDYADLFREADTALYKAKSIGKNRAVFFTESMQKEAEQKLALEHDLGQALQTGQLYIVVQPQFDAQRKQCGGEVLLRWTHPVLGNIPPDKFIPLAEESGLIIRVGSWVLDQACKTLATYAKQGIVDSLSVNVSPRQFRQEEFVDVLREMLAKHDAPPSQLILEITEGHLIEDVSFTIARMEELSSLGIRFSIDDFGTGYSSLAYLKKLPLYELKIDKSFIRDNLSHPTNIAIVQLILGMARNLELRVVAEGVETEDQFNFLVREQCEMMQGFFLGRPMPLDLWLVEITQSRSEREEL